jgi:hypothetical protein
MNFDRHSILFISLILYNKQKTNGLLLSSHINEATIETYVLSVLQLLIKRI